MLNSIVLRGNLTRDPDFKKVKDSSVVNFTLANNRPYKKGDDWMEETTYIDCEAWDTGAQRIAEKFKKGDCLIVVGNLKQETWEDKDGGGKRSKLKIRVQSFEHSPLPPKRGDEESTTEPEEKAEKPVKNDTKKAAKPAKPAADDDDEDIPF